MFRKVLPAIGALGLALILVPYQLLAQAPVTFCTPALAGCGQGPADVFSMTLIPSVLGVLVTIAGGASVIYVLWGGVQMVTAFGDDGKASKGKTTIINSLIGVGLVMVAGTIVKFIATVPFAAGGPNIVVNFMSTVVDVILGIFNALFFISVLYAGVLMGMSRGKSDEFSKATSIIKWAIIGAMVVNFGRAGLTAFTNLPF